MSWGCWHACSGWGHGTGEKLVCPPSNFHLVFWVGWFLRIYLFIFYFITKRLPLTIQWLLPDYQREFPSSLEPPLHMPICLGPVKSAKPTSGKSKTKSVGSEEEETTTLAAEEEELLCNLCFQSATPSQRLVCLYPRYLIVAKLYPPPLNIMTEQCFQGGCRLKI